MKKTLSIVLALAMVFVMSFSVFATGEVAEKPTTPEELGAYYAELLNAEDSNPTEVAEMVLDDLITGEGDEGIYTVEQLPTVLVAFAENVTAENAEKLKSAAEQIELGLADLGIVLPEIPDESESSTEEDEESTLPEDEEPTDDTGFLNTILGILGTIGDLIFGGGDDTGDDPADGTTDDPWGNEGGSTDGESDDLVSDTGDTTVISVAAVALVAGAALVLTRKKSEDAE